jgi:hypothetical protein
MAIAAEGAGRERGDGVGEEEEGEGEGEGEGEAERVGEEVFCSCLFEEFLNISLSCFW